MENPELIPLFSDRISECIAEIGEQHIVGDGTPENGDYSLFVGKNFKSSTEAFSAYKMHARMNSYSVRIQRTVRTRGPAGELKRVYYVCYRAGTPKKKEVVDGATNKRNAKSCRCDYKAHMRIYLVLTDGVLLWNVQEYSNIHNHELLNQNEVRLLPTNRVFSQHCKDRLLALEQRKVLVPKMLKIFAQEQNVIVGCLPFNAKDVHNFFKLGKHFVKNQDASNLLMRCMQLKEKDYDFMFDYGGDEHNRLTHVAWSHANSLRAYHNYGDVVVFDTTYKLNSYDMPVGIWVGVNNFGSSCFFGCCLFRDEKIPSFEWAFQAFLKFMNFKAPKSILTYQDFAMRDAICRVFPNTKHALCMWHIAKKLPSYIQPVLGSQYNAWKEKFWELSRLETVEEFEFGWQLRLCMTTILFSGTISR